MRATYLLGDYTVELREVPDPACRQEVVSPCRQNSQLPQLMVKGAITKSPGFTVDTAEPTSVTRPTNSWPIGRGVTAGPW